MQKACHTWQMLRVCASRGCIIALLSVVEVEFQNESFLPRFLWIPPTRRSWNS